jgi:hypothetical protein
MNLHILSESSGVASVNNAGGGKAHGMRADVARHNGVGRTWAVRLLSYALLTLVVMSRAA